ncbi:unnamed protein product [Echinostoma caproni]|uniref:Solute carrier family 40 protein n=1 Tax=Echinostoma caproni TaxID=27848 RepID=A0A183B2H0_9TREM|nr:unnamed protein product [Echinostoma caproni]
MDPFSHDSSEYESQPDAAGAPAPDLVGMGLTKAWDLRPQWTICLRQGLFGAAVSTALTTCVRIPDQVEEHTPGLTYMVF